ncbi:MAG: hypothetical protein CVV49_17995 [Spirochaetae bacterium HGW-Spirochaetae-5]|nr:MAG: hypothetical protein CVV49_17995 [Spirochaetae bacterium HGW-Spirochaetae-5]
MRLSDLKIGDTVSLLTIFTIILLIPSVLSAQKAGSKTAVKAEESVSGSGFESKDYDLGLVLGLWLPGTIDVEGVSLDKTAGPLFRAFADAYLMPKFAVGAYFNYSSATLEYGTLSASADFYEFGIALKPRFFASPVVAVKPGLNIGYRKSTRERLPGESLYAETDSDGLGLNLSVEIQYLIDSDYIVFFEGGFLSQPTGGNADASVTWAPIIYIAAGICF